MGRGSVSYFAEWEKITNKVFELVKNNEPLMKYICNPSQYPLNDDTPVWKDVFMKNFFPMPKDPLSISDQKCFLNIYINSAYPYEENPYFRQDYLNIDVGCHLETWPVENGRIRPYIICDFIDEMLNNKNISNISIQKVLNGGVKILKFGDMYYGYKLTYKMSNTGALGCE